MEVTDSCCILRRLAHCAGPATASRKCRPGRPVERLHQPSSHGKPFNSIEDGDPRIGARLEIFAAGQYTWIPLQFVESLRLEAPKRLRDLIWSPATLRTSEDFRGQELGEVLLPALAPLSFTSADDEIRLGRATDWVELEDGDFAPAGQKMLLVDGEQVPLLSIRELEIHQAGKAAT